MAAHGDGVLELLRGNVSKVLSRWHGDGLVILVVILWDTRPKRPQTVYHSIADTDVAIGGRSKWTWASAL